ncbi:MAG: serine/threonine protein kinase [Planctomycetaceae bacterium]
MRSRNDKSAACVTLTELLSGAGQSPDCSEDADDAAQAGCPPVEQLWPAAVGESPSRPVAAHVTGCSACQQRVVQLGRELEQARRFLGDRISSGRMFPSASAAEADGCRSHVRGADDSDVQPHQTGERTTAIRPLAMIGKYFVLETICESGQATVLRGLHPSLLVDVVIKLAHRPWRRDETGRARLVAEARALAEIVHPHLARLYDLDFYEDRPFLVLEYVRGRHLGHYRESVAVQPFQIAFLVAKIARAVGAAHERGILHLDLKPENILVTPSGEPVLIDFGLSFLSSPAESRAMEGRWVAGTPEYMAPEQALGHRHALTQRTDIFGLGGVLYYLCVGKEPFAVSQVDGQLRRPEEPDWQALFRADVPGRLKSICRKALSTKPGYRYSTAESLAGTLEAAGRRWTEPALRRLRRFARGLLVLGAASLTAALFVPADRAAGIADLHLTVTRAGRAVPLAEALPLQTRDRLRLEGFLRESSHVALFCVDQALRQQWFGPLQISADGGGARIAYPNFSDSIPVGRNRGAVLVLLVGRRHEPIRRQDAAGLIPSPGLPALPSEHLTVSFDRRRCDMTVTGGASLTATQTKSVQRQIELLQRALAERFDDFVGILAVPAGGDRLDASR